MEMEEGIDLPIYQWIKVTVNIEKYLNLNMPDPVFGMHFRMDRVTFEELVTAVHAHLEAHERWTRNGTPLTHILLMVIWVLATPDSFRSIALRFGVRPSTLYFHCSTIIEALREMSPMYIKWPDEYERGEISQTFQMATGFPVVVGALNCTHVTITKPLVNAADHINRHHTYSFTTQAVVDHRLLVRDLYVGQPGGRHDSRTFRRSDIFVSLLENENIISPMEHLVRDGAYPVLNFLMTPFPDNGHRTRLERRFNTMLSQARVRVENGFGRAKGKWRRLKYLHCYNHRNAVDHITACFVLHNFTVLYGDPLLGEELAIPLNNAFADAAADNADVNAGMDDEPVGPEHPLLANARLEGHEKRQFILHHVIPNANV